MFNRACACLVAVIVTAGSPVLAPAQTTTVAALAWDGTLSGGPRAEDYPPAQDRLDIWVVEDFSTYQDWLLDAFTCDGFGGRGATRDVVAVILDGYPPAGREVLRSVPGTGRCDLAAVGGLWDRYFTSFGGRRLPAGRYKVMWLAAGDGVLPVMFAQAGAHTAGSGQPNNAYQYNPGGGHALPEGVLDPVTSGLNNTGVPIGVNFSITGRVAPPRCRADFNGDGLTGAQDIFDFLIAYFGGDSRADVNGIDGVTVQDLFVYLVDYFVGCPR